MTTEYMASAQGFENLGVIIGTLPDDPPVVRKAIRNGFTAALLA